MRYAARIADEADVERFLSSSLTMIPEDNGDDAGLWREYSDVRYAIDLESRVTILGTRNNRWYEYDTKTGMYEIERDDIPSPREEHDEDFRDEEPCDNDKWDEEWWRWREFNREMEWGTRFRFCGDLSQAESLNLLLRVENDVVNLTKEDVRKLKQECGDFLRYFKMSDDAYVSVARGPFLKISIVANPDFKILLHKVERTGLKCTELTHDDFAAMVDRLCSEARTVRHSD